MHKDKRHERSQQVINKEWQVCHIDGRGGWEGGDEVQLVRMKGLCGMLLHGIPLVCNEKSTEK